MSSTRQLTPDLGRDHTAFGSALGLRRHLRHHLAHALHAQLDSAGGSDGVGNDGANLVLGQLLGQVISQDFGFGMFFLGQLCASGVGVRLFSLTALLGFLDHNVEHLLIRKFDGL